MEQTTTQTEFGHGMTNFPSVYALASQQDREMLV